MKLIYKRLLLLYSFSLIMACSNTKQPYVLEDQVFASQSERIDLEVDHNAQKWFYFNQDKAIMRYKSGWSTIDESGIPFFKEETYKRNIKLTNMQNERHRVKVEFGQSTLAGFMVKNEVQTVATIFNEQDQKIGSLRLSSDYNLYELDIRFKGNHYFSRDTAERYEIDEYSTLSNEYLDNRLVSLKDTNKEIARIHIGKQVWSRTPVSVFLLEEKDTLRNEILEICALLNLLKTTYRDYLVDTGKASETDAFLGNPI